MRRYELLVCGDKGEKATLGFGGRKRANWHAFDVLNRRCFGDLTIPTGIDGPLPGYELLIEGETGKGTDLISFKGIEVFCAPWSTFSMVFTESMY